MTKDEALCMAIEALEDGSNLELVKVADIRKALKACKEALADYKDGDCCTEGCIKCDAREVLKELDK